MNFESIETNSIHWLLDVDRIGNTVMDALLSAIGMLETANMLGQKSGLWKGADGETAAIFRTLKSRLVGFSGHEILNHANMHQRPWESHFHLPK
jgi:2C-methyl-D-erythritol 2,4-cyclodiphosphate synthase